MQLTKLTVHEHRYCRGLMLTWTESSHQWIPDAGWEYCGARHKGTAHLVLTFCSFFDDDGGGKKLR